MIYKVIEGLTTVLHIEATPLVSNPDEIQTLEMLDQLEEYLVDLGATPTCSIVCELKAAQRLTGKELTPLRAAKALAAGAPKPPGNSAVAKRGRTGGPISAGARTPTTQPSQSQRQLFRAPGAQAATLTPSAATANHLLILLSLTPEQWEPFQTIQIVLTKPIQEFLTLLWRPTSRSSQMPSSSTKWRWPSDG